MAINATSTKQPKCQEDWQINFFLHEKNIMDDDGNDPIVISTIINNFGVDRILVDDGSVVEVLIYDAFKKMNLDESLLRPADRFMASPTNQSK